ncbi:Taurine catabolism dioxygenase [Colletotrichum higginsianum IMI 349063]|uniref:Taurine catabolism dioxygenase n=1 Tax=Colletotrichum higginsianum (strain IMI 349063) TaxID=759273 RepID=A0A1B7Y8G7_COLHI|nr:Taurine catabolism dioxygenase [Colletotrichum higginsianum IMI 349063]OBR08339.1 Taurine catabolism dioxygenase [Colletotrichum higginsianum IMI 349063]
MRQVARYVRSTCGFRKLTLNTFASSTFISHPRFHATIHTPPPLSYDLRCLEAPRLSHAKDPDHVRQISQHLEKVGMLKIKLGFPDSDSDYLKQLLHSLHEHHNHQLPISHSATRGWFWDVRPSETNFQAGDHQARSETMNDFPWHTDCSYEEPPPRYFALQVLQHDRYGGGTLSVLNVQRLSELLPPSARAALKAPEYRISIPSEFIKDPSRKHIHATVLATGPDGESTMIRYREDILEPLTDRASRALEELKEALARKEVQAQATVHLRSSDLPKGSIILMDNRRWLHARNHINDPARHLRRVRWDVCPFGDASESRA